jgi:hypothetical protein
MGSGEKYFDSSETTATIEREPQTAHTIKSFGGSIINTKLLHHQRDLCIILGHYPKTYRQTAYVLSLFPKGLHLVHEFWGLFRYLEKVKCSARWEINISCTSRKLHSSHILRFELVQKWPVEVACLSL